MKLTFTPKEKESRWKTDYALLTRTSKIDSSIFKFWADKNHVPSIGHAWLQTKIKPMADHDTSKKTQEFRTVKLFTVLAKKQ